jgi:hypothetical protein
MIFLLIKDNMDFTIMIKSIQYLSLILLVSCSSITWDSDIGPSVGSIDYMLLNKGVDNTVWDFDLKKSQDFKLPQTMRPCCAFGTNHKVRVGKIPIPLIRLSNTISEEDIGSHSYDASSFTVSSYKKTNKSSSENNGLIYTKRGGVLDLAHIRDTADLTVALFYFFFENLGKEKVVELRRELGKATIELKSFDISKFSKKEKWFIASTMASLKAYQMAVAHEIAQWHGYRYYDFFSEEVSAYSPEDLYSNLLGAKISSSIINNKLALSSKSFNKHMTIWLDKTIESLIPISKIEADKLLMKVDGKWWDSTKRLPSKELVIKRNYNLSTKQAPLIIEEVDNAITIELSKSIYGIDLDSLAHYSFEIDKRYHKNFSHIPRRIWEDGVDSYDFEIIAKFDEIADKSFFESLSKD